MKKSVLYVLAFLLALSSCSKDPDVFEEYFEEWDITISYQDVSKSKTYKLLEKLLDHLSENLFSPRQPVHSSYIHTITSTELNNYLRNNKEAAVFFNREDCASVLISTYLPFLKAKGNLYDLFYLELVLTSDMFMYKMNTTEKVQLMILAMERNKEEYLLEFTIMISIMLSSNYPSFVEEVKPMLIEGTPCIYFLKSNDYNVTFVDGDFITEGYISTPGRDVQATDLITGYARQFINDNKK